MLYIAGKWSPKFDVALNAFILSTFLWVPAPVDMGIGQGRHGRFLAGKDAIVAAPSLACHRCRHQFLLYKIHPRAKPWLPCLFWRPWHGFSMGFCFKMGFWGFRHKNFVIWQDFCGKLSHKGLQKLYHPTKQHLMSNLMNSTLGSRFSDIVSLQSPVICSAS